MPKLPTTLVLFCILLLPIMANRIKSPAVKITCLVIVLILGVYSSAEVVYALLH